MINEEDLRQYFADKNKLRKTIRIEWALKELGGKCAACETTDAFLEFDHIDPSTKEFNIRGRALINIEKFLAELEKCQLLCSACHKKKTKDNKEAFYRHRVVCKRGHQYTPENTKWTVDKNGWDKRECIACQKKAAKEYYAENSDKWLEYYHENRERIIERRKEIYEANKEELNKKRAAYREANREKIRAQDRARYARKKQQQ